MKKLIFVAVTPDLNMGWIGLESAGVNWLHVVESKDTALPLIPAGDNFSQRLIEASGLPQRISRPEQPPTKHSFVCLLKPFAAALIARPTAQLPKDQEESLLHLHLPPPGSPTHAAWCITAIHLGRGECEITATPTVTAALALMRSFIWMSDKSRVKYYLRIRKSGLSDSESIQNQRQPVTLSGPLVNRLVAALAIEGHESNKPSAKTNNGH